MKKKVNIDKCGNMINDIKTLQPNLKLLTILPTDMCNYRCKMCHIWGESGWALKEPEKVIKEKLEINKLKGFIDSILTYNKKFNVLISGGEPLLYPDIFELIRFLKSKRLPALLLTNGTLLAQNSRFIVENVTAISTSLDGPPDYHDSVRGKGSFNKVCEGIEEIIKTKRELKSFFPIITVTMVLSKYSYKGMKDFLNALRERFKDDVKIGLEDSKPSFSMKPKDIIVSFEPLLFTTETRGSSYIDIMKEHLDCDVSSAWKGFVEEDIGMDIDWMKESIEDIWKKEDINFSNFVDIDKYFNDINNVFGRTRCIAPWNNLVIRKNGDMYFCADYPDYCIGSIDGQDFNSVWNGEKANKFRNLLSTGLLPICNRCCGLFLDFDFI